jgi:hypothetical protein
VGPRTNRRCVGPNRSHDNSGSVENVNVHSTSPADVAKTSGSATCAPAECWPRQSNRLVRPLLGLLEHQTRAWLSSEGPKHGRRNRCRLGIGYNRACLTCLMPARPNLCGLDHNSVSGQPRGLSQHHLRLREAEPRLAGAHSQPQPPRRSRTLPPPGRFGAPCGRRL